jgi:DNA/RNA endonuclease G (NUC1)
MDIKTLKKCFNYSDNIIKSIHHLQKNEYDTFYSTHFKYPLLVHEIVDENSGKSDETKEQVDRRKIVDPYRQDPEIPSKYQYSLTDYKKLMKYGLSPGHNTPAGYHKTSMEIWNESFLMTNMTPQEMTFNSGLWVLVEAWCRALGTNEKIMNVHIFTGCIPDDEFITTAEEITINIPKEWFKIVVALDRNNPKIVYTLAIVMKNDKMFVKKMDTYQLGGFTIPVPKLETLAKIDLACIMEWYGIFNKGFHRLASLKNIMSISFTPPFSLKIQMEKCNWYGRIIYAKNLEELEQTWKDIQKFEKRFYDLQYHKEYYDVVKERMMEEQEATK